ncbi:MAG: MFS transporter [Spirochaetes bacterium]|nr:MFS transporter [Spirochaetota bacterium]
MDRKRLLYFGTPGTFFVLALSSIVTPICIVHIGGELSISLSQRGAIEAARNLAIVSAILLTGLFVRRVSRKFLITGGLYLMSAGLLFTGLSGSYRLILCSIALLGAGTGLVEALINPMVAALYPENTERHLNRAHAFFSIGVCVSVLLFGELLQASVSWRICYLISACGTLFIGLLLQCARFPDMPDTPHTGRAFVEILRTPRFFLFALAIFVATGLEGGLTFWTASYIQRYYSELPRLWAFGTAIFGGAMALGRLGTARLSIRFPIGKILVIASLCGLASSVLLIRSKTLGLSLCLLAVSGLCTAGFWPSILAIADDSLAVDTTSLFILLISSGMGGFALFPWLMGVVGDGFGLKAGFVFIPALFIAVFFLLLRISGKGRAQTASSLGSTGATKKG